MKTIRETVSDLWGNGYVRFGALLVALGYVPFYFLSMAAASLGN